MSIDAVTLRNVPIFQLLDNDELAELAAHIDEATFNANHVIFKAGDPGGNMHIVLTGKVETFVIDDDGERVVLSNVEAGEMFGELSLLDSEPRSASAVALMPTRTFIIDRDDLQRLFSKKPAAALDILRILGQRIRKTDVLLQSRVARNPNEEIAENLSFGDRVADMVARFGGSWNFIILFLGMMAVWIVLNTWILTHPFDNPPYIGLNLILSMLAALQAPVIMMSQNRQDAKDRIRSELDYKVNLKAELEIMQLHEKIDQLREEVSQTVRQIPPPKAVERLQDDIA
jgi:CRP/FNR family transcriptional regulator, cyclic AMP receptor protein